MMKVCWWSALMWGIYQTMSGFTESFSFKWTCDSVCLGWCDSRSEGSSTCPRALSPAQAQGTPGGTLEDRYHTGWSLLPADTPRSSPDGQSHSHRHPHHPALRKKERDTSISKHNVHFSKKILKAIFSHYRCASKPQWVIIIGTYSQFYGNELRN